MGLFSKKPKPSPTDETPVGIPTSSPARSTSGSTPGSTSGTATKKAPKKGMVDPHEFAMLRAELHDVRARLDASEQAKAIVESRLAALDATTTAMATERVGLGSDDLHVRIAQLEAQVTDVSERAAQAPAFTEPPALPEPASQGPDPVLLARLDELAARVDVVAELATTPAVVAVAVAEADPETLRRLEELDQRVAAVDTLSAQITQLSARVAGQAEFGAQLSVLRDRIAELQHDTDQRGQSIIEAASAATADAELRDRVNALADRLASTEALSGQMGQLAERLTTSDATARQTADQVSLIEQRVQAVATELTNQISELGRDIDGLAERSLEGPVSGVSDELLEALRTSQVKLANEQARYEIAFRHDLATLAEQLRHGEQR